jgi:integrase/recombinase XerD
VPSFGTGQHAALRTPHGERGAAKLSRRPALSEALALTPRQIDLSDRVVVFESLKKRRRGVFRAVPVPPGLLDMLDMVHGIRQAQRRGRTKALFWPWSHMTAWRRVQEVIATAGIPDSPHACPKGLRHGFGVLGHSSGDGRAC